MEGLGAVNYAHAMPDIGAILAENLRSIRLRLGLTQEQFADMLDMKQNSISDLERVKGWVTIAKLGAGLERAGVNPLELIHPDADVESVEVVGLYRNTDPETRKAVLRIMRMAATSPAAAAASSPRRHHAPTTTRKKKHGRTTGGPLEAPSRAGS